VLGSHGAVAPRVVAVACVGAVVTSSSLQPTVARSVRSAAKLNIVMQAHAQFTAWSVPGVPGHPAPKHAEVDLKCMHAVSCVTPSMVVSSALLPLNPSSATPNLALLIACSPLGVTGAGAALPVALAQGLPLVT